MELIIIAELNAKKMTKQKYRMRDNFELNL